MVSVKGLTMKGKRGNKCELWAGDRQEAVFGHHPVPQPGSRLLIPFGEIDNPCHINRHSIREIKISCCSMWPAVLRIGLRPVKNRLAASMGLVRTPAVVRKSFCASLS